MGAREIVKAHGGDWCGTYGLVPGPDHSPKDRSCKVWQVGDRIFVHSFAGDHWKDCRAHLAIEDDNWHPEHRAARTPRPTPLPARPTARVRDLLRTATSPDLVPDAVEYLSSRKLWPLPKGCRLKAHVAAPYWSTTGERPECIGRFPALLAEVRDMGGELVSAHVTYLQSGKKLEGHTPRKLLSPLAGRTGCAVRLVPQDGPVLVVAEGLETALAAHRLLGLPTWSCLSAPLLGRFQPPSDVEQLVVAIDKDGAGISAARKLRDRLRLRVDLRVPRGADFAEDLEAAP